jgi:hypothetical protein
MMKRAFIAAIALVALGAAAIGEAGAQSGEQTFSYVKRQTNHFKFVDQAPRTKFTSNGPARLSVGDQIVQHDNYLNGSGKRVGSLELVCTITRGGSFANAAEQCVATATLPGGTLALSTGGGFDTHEAAIVGGTGRFAGARGTVTTRPSKSQTNRAEFHLLAP